MDKKSLLYIILTCIALTSCNDDIECALSVSSSDNQCDKISSLEKLPANIKNLTAADAEILTKIFYTDIKTKSTFKKNIQDIIPIKDENGITAIYAVNFIEDGYILISATTSFFPVIAVVEHGKYRKESLNTGEEIVLGGIIQDIKLAQEGKHDFNCQPFWSKYLASDNLPKNTKTSDDYKEEFDNWYASQAYGNYRITKLVNCRNTLPDNVYSEFVNAAQTEDLWEGTEYSWENTAYVVERTTETNINIGPLLKTHWNQNGTFSNDGKYLGCVTIATGQIMRFFEYPLTFSWNSMPYDYGNEALRYFLAKLKSEISKDDNGSAKIGDAERVLKNYGYSVIQSDHDTSKIYNHINDTKTPVYARGAKGFLQTGHAWVIDGLYHSEYNVSYTLYRLSDAWYPKFKYDKAEAATPWNNYSAFTRFHMNWGWGGQGDGWFFDNNIAVSLPGESEKRNYHYDRKELYISKPLNK